jgi:hypothetical protein
MVRDPTERPMEPGLAGDLRDWPIGDVLIWLHTSRRTAVLRMRAGDSQGKIWVKGGQILGCLWGNVEGEAALGAMLAQTHGSFTVTLDEATERSNNVRVPTPQCLLLVRDTGDGT